MSRSFTTTAHLFLAEYHASSMMNPGRSRHCLGLLRRARKRLSFLFSWRPFSRA